MQRVVSEQSAGLRSSLAAPGAARGEGGAAPPPADPAAEAATLARRLVPAITSELPGALVHPGCLRPVCGCRQPGRHSCGSGEAPTQLVWEHKGLPNALGKLRLLRSWTLCTPIPCAALPPSPRRRGAERAVRAPGPCAEQPAGGGIPGECPGRPGCLLSGLNARQLAHFLPLTLPLLIPCILVSSLPRFLFFAALPAGDRH